MNIQNPILPGFNPDPALLLVVIRMQFYKLKKGSERKLDNAGAGAVGFGLQ